MNRIFDDATTVYRNFTCSVKSLTATLYFLKTEDFNTFFKHMNLEEASRGLDSRMQMLRNQMKTIKDICENDYKMINKLERVDKF